MRYTKKLINSNYVIDTYVSLNEPWKSPINKLGKLEDIEEDLGIDLIIVFKALTQGFYIKSNDFMKVRYRYPLGLFKTDDDYERIHEYIFEYGNNANDFIYLKDYGKTWALTKEELINE